MALVPQNFARVKKFLNMQLKQHHWKHKPKAKQSGDLAGIVTGLENSGSLVFNYCRVLQKSRKSIIF
jgi:Cu/Zn superoxide dismutase